MQISQECCIPLSLNGLNVAPFRPPRFTLSASDYDDLDDLIQSCPFSNDDKESHWLYSVRPGAFRRFLNALLARCLLCSYSSWTPFFIKTPRRLAPRFTRSSHASFFPENATARDSRLASHFFPFSKGTRDCRYRKSCSSIIFQGKLDCCAIHSFSRSLPPVELDMEFLLAPPFTFDRLFPMPRGRKPGTLIA